MKIFSLSDDSMPEIFCISTSIKSPSHELARVVVDFSRRSSYAVILSEVNKESDGISRISEVLNAFLMSVGNCWIPVYFIIQ